MAATSPRTRNPSLRSPNPSNLKRIAIGIGLGVLGLATVLGIVEGAYRLVHLWAYGVPLTTSPASRLDPELGWQGYASFGDRESRRLRILVVGDSFTTPLGGVTNTQMYPAVLGRALDAEIFAYGGPGYGTLQEALVIARYVRDVRPGLVVLQVCANDFINNSWELERTSYFNNNLAVRPYLVGDVIEYRFPARFGGLWTSLGQHSRAFYSLMSGVDRAGAALAYLRVLPSVEWDIARLGVAFPPFRRATGITDRLIGRIQQAAGATQVVAFSADDLPNFAEAWATIFRERRIPFTDEPQRRVRAEEMKGATLRTSDGAHWNQAGHEIVGRVLAEWLTSLGYVN